MERDFSQVIITLDNILIPDDKLSPTPSMQDGLDSDTETDLRILGCELIQTSGILLKLPQVKINFVIENLTQNLIYLWIFGNDFSEYDSKNVMVLFLSFRWRWLQDKYCSNDSSIRNHL